LVGHKSTSNTSGGGHVQRAKIVNPEGLHARPCHAVVSLARDFEAELRIRNGDNEVNGRSILELMTLSAACGDELEMKADGEDALALLEALSSLIAAGFTEID
jgi:phosphotransferase system HPr (HPr) family protein